MFSASWVPPWTRTMPAYTAHKLTTHEKGRCLTRSLTIRRCNSRGTTSSRKTVRDLRAVPDCRLCPAPAARCGAIRGDPALCRLHSRDHRLRLGDRRRDRRHIADYIGRKRTMMLAILDRAGCSTMGRELSPVRLDVLLTFRAHDQRWAWHIPR